VQDESERVRRLALDALHKLPSRKVARVFLRQALDPGELEVSRERALRALGTFPSLEWVPPIVALLCETDAPASLRLAAEITLKSLPAPMLKTGLLPLLGSEDPGLRAQTAILLSELLGDDPSVRKTLIEFWKSSDDAAAMELTDMVRELGGEEGAALLLDSIARSPLLAYAAAGALARIPNLGSARRVRDMLQDPKTPQMAKQALLAHWAKRGGPDESVREELEPWLIAALADEVLNIRYLSLQALACYPFEKRLLPILDMLAKETSADVVRTAYRQMLKGLGRDPMPLVTAWRGHPHRDVLTGHVVKVLTSQSWDFDLVFQLLHVLIGPPLLLLERRPEAFYFVCAHMMERGGVSLEKVWLFLGEGPKLKGFLEHLLSFMRSPHRHFTPLPLEVLAFHLASAEPELRILYYRLLGAERRAESAEALSSALRREMDERCLAEGKASLRAMLTEAAA
jgi:HEAT repeat protein